MSKLSGTEGAAMNSKNSKVLVTGADGFIGSHLVETLVRRGHDVKAFVIYNSLGSAGWLDECPSEIASEVELYYGDVRDPDAMTDSLKDCEKVIHLASLIAIPHSYSAPHSYVDTNVKGTLNVLQAARSVGVDKIIHTSTSEVYGTAKFVPITEEHPLQGQSPYSASKIAADQMAASFYASFNLPLITIRPFNTYGPRQSARAVIPTIISQILSGRRTLKLGAVSPTRDFNFVQDTVDGFIAALEGNVPFGETINLGSNFEISVKETAILISDCMGVEMEIFAEKERYRPEKSEVERLWADNSKALRLLDWEPKYGGIDGLRRGLKLTIDWMRSPRSRGLYLPDVYQK